MLRIANKISKLFKWRHLQTKFAIFTASIHTIDSLQNVKKLKKPQGANNIFVYFLLIWYMQFFFVDPYKICHINRSFPKHSELQHMQQKLTDRNNLQSQVFFFKHNFESSLENTLLTFKSLKKNYGSIVERKKDSIYSLGLVIGLLMRNERDSLVVHKHCNIAVSSSTYFTTYIIA